MLRWVTSLAVVAVCLVLVARAPMVLGDEGMWLFNNPPKKYLKDTYQFDVTAALGLIEGTHNFTANLSGAAPNPHG